MTGAYPKGAYPKNAYPDRAYPIWGEGVTLAGLSLNAILEASGNVLHITLDGTGISATASVTASAFSNSTLEDVTSAGSVSVKAQASLSRGLDNVSAMAFGEVYTGINSPYQDIVSWTGHPLSGSTVKVRLGNLRGIFGENGEFGLYAGDGWDAKSGLPPNVNSQYIRLGNKTNEFHNVPIKLYDNDNVTIQLEPSSPSFAMGNPLPSGYNSGVGLWQGKDSDGIYKWRVGDPSANGASLSWNGASLNLKNTSLEIGGIGAHLAFGNPPPIAANSGTGIWIDSTGFYGIQNDDNQIFIDTVNGVFYAGDARLDEHGLTLGSQLVINRAQKINVDVELAFWRTDGGNASIFWNGDTMWTTRQFRPNDLIINRISATEPVNPVAGMVWLQP